MALQTRRTRRSLTTVGAAVATTLSMLIAVPLAAGAPSTEAAGDLTGFTPQRAQLQHRLETGFKEAIAPEQAERLSTALSDHPQLIGTPGKRRSAEYSLRKLKSWGLDASLDSYSVYASVPKDISVSMTAPQQRELEVKEGRYPGQKHYEDAVDGYNAYSPAGDVTGDVVYANYGLPEDYQHLDQLGVDVTDKIVLVRYGKSFRGVKSKVAEDHGAAGVIIYSDPADDGFGRGKVYPDGPWRPADSIQRGSIQYIFNYPGDPLTPGEPSVSGQPRLDPSEAANLPGVPTTPISYGQASYLLENLGGATAPEDWQGGLDFDYHVGPGPTRSNLDLDIDYQQLPVNNVITEIPGRSRPDEKVVIGAHYDGWVYGTNDNTSGWVSAMQIAYGLSQLMKTGWRPERTIVIAGWDGEEYGLLGSTEYAEKRAEQITSGAVAYLNMDGTAGKNFSASSVPALDDLLRSVTKSVPDPDHGTVYQNWQEGDSTPAPGRLGSGSDYTSFLDHLGVPAAGLGFSTPSGEYHSTIDDLDMTRRFLDPGFVHHSVAAETTGLMGLRLAQANVLPMNYSRYAGEVQDYLGELEGAGLNLDRAKDAAADWQRAAQRLETRRAALTAGPLPRPIRTAIMNHTLQRQERALLSRAGLPDRSWYRHQIYAPGEYTGYAAQMLPGVTASVEAGDTATARTQLRRLTRSLREASILARIGG